MSKINKIYLLFCEVHFLSLVEKEVCVGSAVTDEIGMTLRKLL